MRGNSFFSAREPEPLGGGGLDGNLRGLHLEGRRQVLAHGRQVRGEFGALGDQRQVGIPQNIPLLLNEVDDVVQEPYTIGPTVTGIRVGKVLPEVSERQGAKQGVHQGMREDIGIGVSEQAPFMRNRNSSQDQGAIFNKGMDIKSGANSKRQQRRGWGHE